MFYTVYQTTNKINGKIYIGKHITKDVNDDYLGSGKTLKKAIEKYGKENFQKIILFVFDNKEDMTAKEREIVNETFIQETSNYNIVPGGSGFDKDFIMVRDESGKHISVSKNHPKYLSGEYQFISKGFVNVTNDEGDYIRLPKNDPRILSGEFRPLLKGKLIMKDVNGNNVIIEKTANLETYKGVVSDTILVKDLDGNHVRVSKDDPLYLNGTLIAARKNAKHSEESKAAIKEKRKFQIFTEETRKKLRDKAKGRIPHNIGKIWINSKSHRKNKTINECDLEFYVSEGWVRGKVNFKTDTQA